MIWEQAETGKAIHFWFFGFLLEGEIEIPKAGGPEGHLTVGAAARIQGWARWKPKPDSGIAVVSTEMAVEAMRISKPFRGP